MQVQLEEQLLLILYGLCNTLKYSDNGTVVLNGDNSSNANAEGFIGTVDLSGTTGSI